MKSIFSPIASPGASKQGFTFIELLVVLAVLALLAVTLLPALANTQPDSRAFQCLNNQRQIMLAWRMYAEDNNDILPPNDYPYTTTYFTAGNKHQLANWVVGTMIQPLDSFNSAELTDPNSLLSAYVKTPASYRCPADKYIDPTTHRVHVRSISMNSAVGTLWSSSTEQGGFSGLPIGSPVQGGWLNGSSYNPAQTQWRTYGKFSSIVQPTPANLFVIMDESPYSINEATMYAVAASSGTSYLVDFPAGNHDAAATISFADGHSIIHKWTDPRTISPQNFVQPGQGGVGGPFAQNPNNPDCAYLASITSAPR